MNRGEEAAAKERGERKAAAATGINAKGKRRKDAKPKNCSQNRL